MDQRALPRLVEPPRDRGELQRCRVRWRVRSGFTAGRRARPRPDAPGKRPGPRRTATVASPRLPSPTAPEARGPTGSSAPPATPPPPLHEAGSPRPLHPSRTPASRPPRRARRCGFARRLPRPGKRSSRSRRAGSDGSCRSGRPRPTTSTVATSFTLTTRCGTPASAKPIQLLPGAQPEWQVLADVAHRLEVHLRSPIQQSRAQHTRVRLHRRTPTGGRCPSSVASLAEQSDALPQRSAREPSLLRYVIR